MLASRAVAGLASTAGRCGPAMYFSPLPGRRTTASALRDALANGAAALSPNAAPAPTRLRQGRRRARRACQRGGAFYPRQPETIVAVTGTSGKTSVAAFMRQIWAALGCDAASIGTIGVVSRPLNVYGSLTTPDTVALHRDSSTGSPRAASPISRMEASSTASTRSGSTACGSPPAPSPISRATTSTTTRRSKPISRRSCAFSSDLLPDGAPAVIDADSDIAPRVIAAARTRGLAVVDGRRGGDDPARLGRARSTSRRRSTSSSAAAAGCGLPLPGDFQVSNALVAASSASRREPTPRPCSPRWSGSKARRAGWSGSATSMARRSLSTTPTSPTRWKRRWRRCDPSSRAARRRLRLRRRPRRRQTTDDGGDRDRASPIWSMSPTTIRVPRIRRRSAPPILAAAPRRAEIGDRGEAIRAAIEMLAGRCAVDRRKRPRNRPDPQRSDAAVLGRGSAGGARGGGMTALWTEAELARRAWRARARRSPCRSTACRSTPARLRPATSSSPSRAKRATVTITPRAPSRRAPPRRSSRATAGASLAAHEPTFAVDDTLRAMERLAKRRARARRRGGRRDRLGRQDQRQGDAASRSVACGATHASAASYNNHWGVPLTLARLPAERRLRGDSKSA